MFGKGVHQEEEGLLRHIIRSINKKIDYTAREGEGTRFTLRLKVRGHETDVSLDLDDLKLAKNDMNELSQMLFMVSPVVMLTKSKTSLRYQFALLIQALAILSKHAR